MIAFKYVFQTLPGMQYSRKVTITVMMTMMIISQASAKTIHPYNAFYLLYRVDFHILSISFILWVKKINNKCHGYS